MTGIMEIAGRILLESGVSSESVAQNISNMTTPGYKSSRLFSALMESGVTPEPGRDESFDLSPGVNISTGSPMDVAIAGDGFFTIRSGEGFLYTRNGQFSRDADGCLVTSQGLAVQSSAGDIVTASADIVITSDGVVLDAGTPVARLSIARIAADAQTRSVGGTLFTVNSEAVGEMATPRVQQGFLESSNVSTATEMLALMTALRRAESGQRLVQLYDDLMSKATTAFGQN